MLCNAKGDSASECNKTTSDERPAEIPGELWLNELAFYPDDIIRPFLDDLTSRIIANIKNGNIHKATDIINAEGKALAHQHYYLMRIMNAADMNNARDEIIAALKNHGIV